MNSFYLIGLFCLIGVLQCYAVTHTITVNDNFYSPSSITINPGDTIHWTTTGSTSNQHNVYQTVSGNSLTALGGGFNSGAATNSFTFDNSFNTAGTFFYACVIHGNGMKGSIVVDSSTTAGTTSTTAKSTTATTKSTTVATTSNTAAATSTTAAVTTTTNAATTTSTTTTPVSYTHLTLPTN